MFASNCPTGTILWQHPFRGNRMPTMEPVLQIPLAVMECTPAVLQSKEEQDILRKICIRNRYGGSPENFVTASVLAIQTPEMVGNPVPSSIGYQANTRHATTRICTVDDSSFSVFYGA